MFPGVKDRILKAELERFAAAEAAKQPFSKIQVVRVTFTTPGNDVDIPHTLSPTNPEDVQYVVIGRGAAGVVYQDLSGTRLPWQPTHIFLRSSEAMSAILLLFLGAHDVSFFS